MESTEIVTAIAAESYTPDFHAFPTFNEYRVIVSAIETTLKCEAGL